MPPCSERFRRAFFALFVFLVVPGVVGCASFSQPEPMQEMERKYGETSPEGLQPESSVMVVENNMFHDALIYMGTGGADMRRLGSVTSYQSRSFEVPSSLRGVAADPHIMVQVLGNRKTWTSRELMLRPRGQILKVEIPSRVHLTNVSVWDAPGGNE